MLIPATFFRNHLMLIPGALALAALVAHFTPLDRALAGLFYDTATAQFPVRASVWLEKLGHRQAKTVVTLLWLMLLGVTACAYLRPRFRPQWAHHRNALLSATVGMGLGPIIVVRLKSMNAYHCPWDLREFGGSVDFMSGWFVPSAEIGYCFPGGHASSGFCLIALYFLACEMGKPRAAAWALWGALGCGTLFSLIRMVQGAHFLSHNLWAAAICWELAALAFVPLLLRQRQTCVAA